MSLKRSQGTTPGLGSALPDAPVEVFGDLDDVDMATTAPADRDIAVFTVGTYVEDTTTTTDSASYNTSTAYLTTDGDTGTRWDSRFSPLGAATHKLNYDFGVDVTLNRITMLQNDGTNFADSVKIYWSDNGSAYTLVDTFTTGTGANTMDFAPALTHRYWRLEENSGGSIYWYVHEVKFYLSTDAWLPAEIGQVPTGGTADQVLTKDSATDFDSSWQDAAAGGGGKATTFLLGGM